MSIASVGSTSATLVSQAATQSRAPDRANDHDQDDIGGGGQAVQSAPPPGTGQVIDKMA